MIGTMRERVTIQVPSSSADSAGDMGQPAWTKLATVWADIRPLSGRERLQAAMVQGSATYRVSLWYRDDVTLSARLVCLGPDFHQSTMQIHAIVKDNRQRRLELDCSEVI